MFSQLRTKVSAGFTNVSGLDVGGCGVIYCSLSVSACLCPSYELVSSRRKVVIVLCATLVLYCCIVRAIVSQVLLMYAIIAVVTGPELTLVC